MTSQPPADVAATAAPIVSLRPSAGGLSWTRRWAGLLIVALGLPLLTAVLVAVRSDVSVQSMLLIYLLAVVVVAVVGGVVPALLGAVASFFLVNWFLTPPTTPWWWRAARRRSTWSCSFSPRSWSASPSSSVPGTAKRLNASASSRV